MSIFKNYLSAYWGLAIVLVIIFIAIAKVYTVKKASGKLTNASVEDILKSIEDNIFIGMNKFDPVYDAEKTGGREAAKKIIESILMDYVKNTNLLNPEEKAIIMSVDLSSVVDYIENQLISMKALTPEPTTSPVEQPTVTETPKIEPSAEFATNATAPVNPQPTVVVTQPEATVETTSDDNQKVYSGLSVDLVDGKHLVTLIPTTETAPVEQPTVTETPKVEPTVEVTQPETATEPITTNAVVEATITTTETK